MQRNKLPRRNHDNYPTPLALARVGMDLAWRYVLDGATRRDGWRIYEPGCGDIQPFLQAAADVVTGSVLAGSDVRAVAPASEIFRITQGDFLTEPTGGPWDIIITNPPYTLAEAFVCRALEGVSPQGAVVMLTRQSFLASVARQAFWRAHPPVHVATIVPRPSFSGDGATDGCEYVYCVWAPWMRQVRQQYAEIGTTPTTLGWVTWVKPTRRS